MVSQKQYKALKNASNSYLSNEEFGIRDIENVMSEIFGTERTGDEAVSWARYWNELNVYEENLRVMSESESLAAETTSIAEEMYGAAVFDEGDDDESSPITFIRGVNLERLAIEAFVDLANPKLIVRFQDTETPTTSEYAKGKQNDTQPSKAKSSEWSAEDAKWASNGDLDW
jgi:hypothetical protein